jgi:hypothetical protein
MLKAISWNQYFLFTGIVAVAWYAYVLLRRAGKSSGEKDLLYSAKDRMGLFGDGERERRTKTSSDVPVPRSGMDTQVAEFDEAPDWGLVTQTIIEEIRVCIYEVDEEGKDEELVPRLEVILANYEELRKTAFGKMIDEFIIKEVRPLGFMWDKEYVETFWH